MKIKIFNNDCLDEKDIHDQVIRVKAIIVNQEKEVLLGEAFGTIQFPGGHLEEGESLTDALKREVLEETGILLKNEYEPFFGIKHYLKDYPVVGNNRSIEIYYFKVFTDERYHLENCNLDDQEKAGDFHLFYVPIKKVKKILKKNINKNPINGIISKEMLFALKYWKRR